MGEKLGAGPSGRSRSHSLIRLILFAGIFCVAGSAHVTAQRASMDAEFRNPPDSAKPRAWWYWMNANITREGITADLEWMKRTNIAGFQMWDGDLGIPVLVDKPTIWMTPDWKAALHHAAAEAARLHLEMGMGASAGWSETGGPWVKPEEGMKKYAWSETRVIGPSHLMATLSHPPVASGQFQDMESTPTLQKQFPTYYADAAVVAYKVPDDDVRMADLHPKVSCSCGAIDGGLLMDGDLRKAITLPIARDTDRAWIQFELEQPFRVRAVSIANAATETFGTEQIPQGEVQSSQDGSHWKLLLKLPGQTVPPASRSLSAQTYSLPESNARFYRLVFQARSPNLLMASLGVPQSRDPQIAEIEFHSGPRVNDWEDKASFGTLIEQPSTPTAPVGAEQVVSRKDVIDLTSRMHADGTLDWDVPAGRWIILRVGYSLTGVTNHPAIPAGIGLEVDKLSRKHVESYFQRYLEMVSGAAGWQFGKSFRYFTMDSWEAGQGNWTDDMRGEFQRRQGYDMTPYLPVLTGRIVESAEISDAFLWDFRRNIADMLAENYYATATKYLAKFGMGLYAEAMGQSLPTTGDGLLNKGQVSIPMGEFWTPAPDRKERPEYGTDVREASSAAHIYGKQIVAAESFTTLPDVTPWGQSPFYLKLLADEHFAQGINRIFFSTIAHQPFVDDGHKPGLSLGYFGQDYGRNVTWSEQARPWNTYLARCSYLLQKGSYVADVAYFYGEGAPVTVPFWKPLSPLPPTRYGYDYLNADVLLHQTSAKNGQLRLASGMTYRLLVIPTDVRSMSLPVLEKIRELVAGGVVVIGAKPTRSPSLSDGLNANVQVRTLADQVWGKQTVTGEGHAYGKGKVYVGGSVEEILGKLSIAPDFDYETPQSSGSDVNYALPRGDSNADLVFIHRRDNDGDIYFVSTQKRHEFNVRCAFRVAGREPELWHPDTGNIEPAKYRIDNGRTVVNLQMDPGGSLFVIFRKRATSQAQTLPRSRIEKLKTITGPWQVTFPSNWGAPPHIELEQLESWTKSPDEGVKYFSGTATYSKDVDAPKGWFRPGARIVLDLGTVRELAQVSINGEAVGGVLWKPPFRADLTNRLKPGVNRIEVQITNLWPNRMIGDLQPGATRTYTFAGIRPFKKESPLMESGLLGPVEISLVAQH